MRKKCNILHHNLYHIKILYDICINRMSITQQIADIKSQNDSLMKLLIDNHIIFDKFNIEPNLLTQDELLTQYISLNAYLKWIVIKNSLDEMLSR